MTSRTAPRWASAVLLAMLASGCTNTRTASSPSSAGAQPGREVTTAAPTAAVVVLFDISGSTGSPVARKSFLDDFQKVVESTKGGELIQGDVITDNTLATATVQISGQLPTRGSWNENPLVYNDKMSKARTTILSSAKSLLSEHRPESGTDLMNAFRLAEKLFNGDVAQSAQRKVLVVFSDMVEQSRYHDFTAKLMDEKSIAAALETEKREARLPRLEGVSVWIAGATSSAHDGLKDNQIRGIESFWVSYFRACGAELKPSHYGTRLLDFAIDVTGAAPGKR